MFQIQPAGPEAGATPVALTLRRLLQVKEGA